MFGTLLVLPLLLPAAQQIPEDGRGQGLFNADWHRERRELLMSSVDGGLIVVRGLGKLADYREFRQDNNFWYLTGISTPLAAMILVPERGETWFFSPTVDPASEIWAGDLIDPAEASAITGIKNCLPLGDGKARRNGGGWSGFENKLSELLDSVEKKVIWVQKKPAENWMMSRDNLEDAESTQKEDPFDGRLWREEQFALMLEASFDCEVMDLTDTLDVLRLHKTPEEFTAMRFACEVTGLAHVAAIKNFSAGDYEWQIAADMTATMLSNGAMGPGYMAIVGSGANSCILHYSINNRRLVQGDVVLIDYGAEFNHYIADITRTWPVNGKFSKRQREAYEAVYAAQEAAFVQCKPGNKFGAVAAASSKVIADRGFGRMWHGTSHWLGMATHDVGKYNVILKPGMVFTVEPGIYLPDEAIGIRIEDIVGITEDGYELLSSSIPRSLQEIEALRKR